MHWQQILTRSGQVFVATIGALWQAFHGFIGQSPLEAEDHHAGVRTDGGKDPVETAF